MAAAVQCRQQENSFAVMKEKEDDLALFLQMRNIEDYRENNYLINDLDLLGSELDNSATRKMESAMATEKPISDGFLNSEDKSNFEWLLTSPDLPLFPSSDMESQETVVDQIPAVSNGHSKAPNPKLANPLTEPTSKSKPTTKRSTSATRKPSPNVSRSSTPTPRPILPSTTKPTRSSTPTSRSTVKRSSTPTKPTPRSSTPNTRSSSLTATSKSDSKSSASIGKPVPALKNMVPSRRSSPTVKPRPQRDDGLSNVRSSTLTNGRQKQQSSSHSRTQNGNNAYDNMRCMIAKSRIHADCRDDVSPVLMGTQMVERVINMRKLAPPKNDNLPDNNNNSSQKSSSQESSGFGRSLSKKSFEMALRHMDIRRSVPGTIRSLMTNVPTSSVYSVRPGPTKCTTISVSDSPLASSSTVSSNFEYDFGSET